MDIQKIMELHKLWVISGPSLGTQMSISNFVIGGTNFNFRRTFLNRAHMLNGVIEDADFSDASFKEAVVEFVDFKYCRFDTTTFNYAQFRGCRFLGCEFVSSAFADTKFYGCFFDDLCIFAGVDLRPIAEVDQKTWNSLSPITIPSLHGKPQKVLDKEESERVKASFDWWGKSPPVNLTKKPCVHEWVVSPGLFKLYEDCKHCGTKREEEV